MYKYDKYNHVPLNVKNNVFKMQQSREGLWSKGRPEQLIHVSILQQFQ